jgi:glycosyltransferase involved in cell wall biosynthesis
VKIAFIGTRGIPPNYGGSETYVEQLALQLVARGDEVWVYGSPLPPDPKLRERVGAYPPGIHRVEVPTIRTKHADNFVRSLLATLHVCFQRQVEVVEFNNMGPAMFSFLPRLFGKKVVGSIRAMDSHRQKWGFFARLYLRLCERLICIFPHATTSNSLAIVEYYRSRHGVTVHYTPNGVAFPDTRSNCRRIESFGLQRGGFLLYVARLVPEKGCHVLISAWQQVQWPGMKLVIAGGESFASDYAAQLKRSAGEGILFMGHVGGELLDELFSNAYAFVLPSAIEGMSNSLLSAMAHGRPVVVSDIAENIAVVEGAEAAPDSGEAPALVFRLGDVGDLAEKLEKLRDEAGQLDWRGMHLQEHVRRNFTWEKSADRSRSIYKDLLKK